MVKTLVIFALFFLCGCASSKLMQDCYKTENPNKNRFECKSLSILE